MLAHCGIPYGFTMGIQIELLVSVSVCLTPKRVRLVHTVYFGYVLRVIPTVNGSFPLYSIRPLTSLMEIRCFVCEVRTESLYIMYNAML
jgi:hypothetical protein